MTNTEIKEALYKQTPIPIAKLEFIRLGVAYYSTYIVNKEGTSFRVNFQVPVNDMGNTDYLVGMYGKLLDRYIVNN